MTNSWFETRPWIATLGEVAQQPYVLEDSTPLADLAATVEARGDAEAISYYGLTLTWKEFDRWSTAFAAFLAEQGVRPGDRIGIYEQNTPARSEERRVGKEWRSRWRRRRSINTKGRPG